MSQFSAGGNVNAPVFVAGNTEIPPAGGAGSSVSGCDPDDFTGMPDGAVALMQRGTCPFTQKYDNARDEGAGAALIFNDGFAGREEPLFIVAPTDMEIPAIMTSNDVGEELVAQARGGQNPMVHVALEAATTPITQYNVIADSRKGDPSRTVVVGAHLDSVEAGPGINDNGSGSSTLIEMAEQISRLGLTPKNRLRFAFWGAEEAGLVGSTAYVNDQVANGGIDDIEANLNFDMVGSPNFVRFVYDGDLSDSAPPPGGAPNGSGQIEGVFARYFSSQGLAHDPTAFDGRSDYGPFIANGVPAGGLFTGAEGIKTAAQAATYGGTADGAVRPVLPPGMRHDRQPEQHGARPDAGCRGSHRVDARPLEERRHAEPEGDGRAEDEVAQGRTHEGAEVPGPVPRALTHTRLGTSRGGHEPPLVVQIALRALMS